VDLVSIEEAIDIAARRWPALVFKRKSSKEASAPCPFCNDGEDRFLIFNDGGYYCRQCQQKGWLDDDKSDWSSLSDEERRYRKIEQRLARLERQQREQEERLKVLERMHRCKDHLRYYDQVAQGDALDYWIAEGMTPDTIARYKLGYCQRCPTDREGRPSYTIPVISNGELWNIRHRLKGANDGDKYRPHMAGLPNVLFNADYLRGGSDDILIVEGEKKSIVTAQVGFPNVGIMGKSGFNRAWIPRFDRFERVYVALDPDATSQAVEVARLFGDRGRVVSLPGKIDDLIVRHDATVADIYHFMQVARPAGGERAH
jgi:hypothetical protein